MGRLILSVRAKLQFMMFFFLGGDLIILDLRLNWAGNMVLSDKLALGDLDEIIGGLCVPFRGNYVIHRRWCYNY